MEFLCKLCQVQIASSIKTYDFSTLYTNLPLDYIYECLEKLIIKMFQNSISVGLMVISESRQASLLDVGVAIQDINYLQLINFWKR